MHTFGMRLPFLMTLIMLACGSAHADDQPEILAEEDAIMTARQIFRKTLAAGTNCEVSIVRLHDEPQKPDDTVPKPGTTVFRTRLGQFGRAIKLQDDGTADKSNCIWPGFKNSDQLATLGCYEMVLPLANHLLLQDYDYDEYAVIGTVVDRKQLKHSAVFETAKHFSATGRGKTDVFNVTAGSFVWRSKFDGKKNVLLSIAYAHSNGGLENHDEKLWTNALIREFSEHETVDGVTYPKRINVISTKLGKAPVVERYLVTSFKPVPLTNGDPRRPAAQPVRVASDNAGINPEPVEPMAFSPVTVNVEGRVSAPSEKRAPISPLAWFLAGGGGLLVLALLAKRFIRRDSPQQQTVSWNE